jgi:hypothetical protein
MTTKPICRFCRHWGTKYNYFDLKKYLTPAGHGGYGWTDRAAAIADIHRDRAEGTSSLPCKVLEGTVEIDIDQGGGWDAGGASVDEVSTPGGFGCNRFELYSVDA